LKCHKCLQIPDNTQLVSEVSENVGGDPAAPLPAAPPSLPLRHQELQQMGAAGLTTLKGKVPHGLTQGNKWEQLGLPHLKGKFPMGSHKVTNGSSWAYQLTERESSPWAHTR
jgi:hypothetical protein